MIAKVLLEGFILGYMLYVLGCVYGLNGARDFLTGFWQMFVILSVMNVMDRISVKSGLWERSAWRCSRRYWLALRHL